MTTSTRRPAHALAGCSCLTAHASPPMPHRSCPSAHAAPRANSGDLALRPGSGDLDVRFGSGVRRDPRAEELPPLALTMLVGVLGSDNDSAERPRKTSPPLSSDRPGRSSIEECSVVARVSGEFMASSTPGEPRDGPFNGPSARGPPLCGGCSG
eukprot:CAMPEP_0181332562 /NCGR_PEP_ID=MMETSP1101-20121128/25169_1 /TAXON_ID=46948 /ORGANISM="Rhodomonas abbreviata, Strain Caron Lab Isolate" /LENGTH=153 /DNA_ID=CAMNT_0023442233 /DNA_START=20 /DNA_END=477 /DNA_ORIENTATION=+